MPDWNGEVTRNLRKLKLPMEEKDRIIVELADYLEDRYQEARAEGLPEAQAIQVCLQEAEGWRRLEQNIGKAKSKEEAMNYRTRTLWVPGLATLATASVLLALLQQIVFLQPRIIWKDGGALVLHPSWWLLLPLCGAIGAHLSRRAGGSRFHCLVSSVFPAVTMLAASAIFLPISILVDRNTYVLQHALYFTLLTLNWTVVPATTLLLGAAMVCRRREPHVGVSS